MHDYTYNNLLALCEEQGALATPAVFKLTLTQDGTAPGWIQLVPAGKSTALDGRKFNNSQPGKVVEKFDKTDLDLPIDFDHATEKRAPQGKTAPAAGWITALEVREGSIWARVEWTPMGEAALTSREYRYISPAFYHSKTGVVLQISSAGLTNKPALDTLAAVARETKTEKGISSMDPKLLAALSLGSEANIVDVVAAIMALRVQQEKLAGDLKAAEQLLAMASEATPALDKFVPRADFDAVKLSLEKAETSIAEQAKATQETAIAAAMSEALKAGKITPATVDYHKAQCSQEGGLERFAEYVKNAAPVVEPSGLDSKPIDKTAELSEMQKKVAKLCGLTDEQFKAQL